MWQVYTGIHCSVQGRGGDGAHSRCNLAYGIMERPNLVLHGSAVRCSRKKLCKIRVIHTNAASSFIVVNVIGVSVH